ncbi:hypothetical protein SALWKB2_0296 [Snodgrassella alvi wkB2]|nr:hypothetical protein SALWKB2_0296 [Snodgrassella alvi wkB2]
MPDLLKENASFKQPYRRNIFYLQHIRIAVLTSTVNTIHKDDTSGITKKSGKIITMNNGCWRQNMPFCFSSRRIMVQH